MPILDRLDNLKFFKQHYIVGKKFILLRNGNDVWKKVWLTSKIPRIGKICIIAVEFSMNFALWLTFIVYDRVLCLNVLLWPTFSFLNSCHIDHIYWQTT